MARRQRPVRWRAEYIFFRIFYAFFALLPLSVANWLGRRIGDLWYLVDKRHRELGIRQVNERLGLDGAEAKAFIRKTFRHFGMVLAEFCHLDKMNRASDFEKYVDLGETKSLVLKLLEEGKGVIFVTGHYGNWEMINTIAAVNGLTGASIARPLDNPYLNDFTKGIRERMGMRILDKFGAIRGAMKALKRNNVIGILSDQDAGSGRYATMSRFFGTPSSTVIMPAQLAMRTGSPILVGVARRTHDAKTRFVLRHAPEILYPDPAADEFEETQRLVDAINASLEGMIREAPEQWLWIHRRWKTKELRDGNPYKRNHTQE